jgi:hypothetical protein
MKLPETFALLVLGSVLLAGCGTREDEAAAEPDAPAPAVETPAAEATDVPPADEADPAMSDTLPTDDDPPPVVPSPDPND